MSNAQEIKVKTNNQELSHRNLWSALNHFLHRVGHDRLPEFVKVAISVAEPAGRVTFQAAPYPVPEEGCGVLTILSANLWHDWPRFRGLERRLDSFADLIDSLKADLILLQEVARTPFLRADEWLAKRLGMAFVYSRANGSKKIGFEEGLAVYSRFPLKRLPHVRHMGRTGHPFSRRLALGVEVDTPCGEIMAFSTHLGLVPRHNAAQLHELHAWVDEITEGRSAVIAGDFNAPEHTHQIRHARSVWTDTFREIYQHGHAATHEIRWPWGGVFLSHRLDYIFLQPGSPSWQVIDVQHVDAKDGPHSDHRAVLARLSPVHKAA